MLKYYSGYDLEPAIYFIIKDTVVYIGCSNKMAVIDWGKHVTLDGDFYTRLRDYDDYIFAEDYEVHFLSFSCNDIEKYLDYPYIKRELEYIEDILHGLFNRSSFINYKLLSDTKSSAPDEHIMKISLKS